MGRGGRRLLTPSLAMRVDDWVEGCLEKLWVGLGGGGDDLGFGHRASHCGVRVRVWVAAVVGCRLGGGCRWCLGARGELVEEPLGLARVAGLAGGEG